MKAAIQKIILVVLLAGLAIIPVQAQDETALESLEIAIWPEYDRPSALVIYLARLDSSVELPAVVELPIPAGVGEPHAVAAWYPDGSLDDRVTWTRTVTGDIATIRVETETSGVWLEFYTPLEMVAAATNFRFVWLGGLAINSLSYEVKHPLGASQMQISPAGETLTAEDGYVYTRTELGAQGAADTVAIELSYNRPARPEIQPAVPYAGNPALERLDVGIWPEYDQPQALVILEGQLPADLPLPAKIALPIPPEVGDPFAVAQVGQGNQLLVAPFEREIIGDWAWVVVETESTVFQVEYYTPLVIEDQVRSFSYYWPGGIRLGELTYGIQHPTGVESMRVLPPGGVSVEQDGLSYTSASLGAQAVDDTALISFEYSKTSDVLTVDAPQSSIDRPDTTTGGTPNFSVQFPYILGGFGAILVLVGVLLFIRTRREDRIPPKRVRKRATGETRTEDRSRDMDVSSVYCHVCGTQSGASDIFCRRCGAELRK